MYGAYLIYLPNMLDIIVLIPLKSIITAIADIAHPVIKSG
jgi:hypothetical protein